MTARATATAASRSAAWTVTTLTIFSTVCALTMLAALVTQIERLFRLCSART